VSASPSEVRWLELDRARRRRIGRAVRKGRAVKDPRDAPYAVGVADATLEWLWWRSRFRPLHLLLLVVLLAEIGFTWSWSPGLFVYPLVVFTWLRLRAPRLRRKIAQSRGANAALAEATGLEPAVMRMPGRDFFRPGSRVRQMSLVCLTVSLAATLALALAAAVYAHRRADRGLRRRIASAPASTRAPPGCRPLAVATNDSVSPGASAPEPAPTCDCPVGRAKPPVRG
jgi:hypothetical protein